MVKKSFRLGRYAISPICLDLPTQEQQQLKTRARQRFRAAGIIRFNKDLFSEHLFAPAEVANQKQDFFEHRY